MMHILQPGMQWIKDWLQKRRSRKISGIAAGRTFEEALNKQAPSVSKEELETIVRKVIAERSVFVAEKGKAALGPLMGVVMAEVRGSVDGKVVSEILKTEIEKAVGSK